VTVPTVYECDYCGYRGEVGADDPRCPDCGRRMRNISVPRE